MGRHTCMCSRTGVPCMFGLRGFMRCKDNRLWTVPLAEMQGVFFVFFLRDPDHSLRGCLG